ncbi:hemopexin repeat-containing protein [Streptomyces sp. NPDC095602]|uniref:hemopexin repeat-containing protein n=1 Tax=Streptomyces sp. NPDC095602 TaxID=3155819 RepID=UPI0033343621
MPTLKTAIAWPNDKVYLFFNDSTYTRYNGITGDIEDSGLPLTAWDGLTTTPDAFVWWGAGKAYAFLGSKYVRYDEPTDRVDPAYRPPQGTPLPLAPHWPGLPDGSQGGMNWQTGIDAAVNWGTGKLYMFKGDSYLRYDVTADRVDPQYPRKISPAWPGVFTSNLDAAIYPGGRFAYFFRGDTYQRFDVDQDQVDQSGPLAAFRPTTPAGALQPARLLTLSQANGLMADLIRRGKLTLKSPPFVEGPSGVTSPQPAQRVAVKPARINGIRYTNEVAPSSDVMDNIDQRMLIALYRLTKWVNASTPDISEILHLGIGHGSGPANDCHNEGRALDFSGLRGTINGTSFHRSILTHWGSLPNATGVRVRISPSVDSLAFALFSTTFRYATFECEANGIGAANRWPMPDLGGSGFVIYPDYGGDPQLRAAHQNHIHMQTGLTRTPHPPHQSP